MGQNLFVWTITDGSCITTDTVNLNVTAVPALPFAGPDQSLCDTFSTNLTGSNPAPGTGVWTVVSGIGTVGNSTSPNTTINILSSGANLISWTVTTGPCIFSDTMEIMITQPSVLPDAGLDQDICVGDTAFIAGNSPVDNGLWLLPNLQGNIDSPTDSMTFVTNLPVGVQPIVWRITENACIRTDTVLINVLPIPAPDAGPDQFLCDTNAATLAAQTLGFGTGTWTILSGPGSLSNPNDSTAVLSGLQVATTILEWRVDNGSCDGADTVEITVNDPPSNADAGSDQSLCDQPDFTLAAIPPAVGTGTWTSLGTAILADSSDPATTASGLSVGFNDFVWTVSQPLCQDRIDTVTIEVVALPFVEAGPDFTICEGDSLSLIGLPFTGMGLWSDQAGTANFSHPDSNVTSVSNLVNGQNIFYLTVVDGPCQAEDSTMVQVDQLPTQANAGPDQIVPDNFTSLEGNIPSVGSGVWTVILGDGSLADPTLASSEVSDLTLGSNELVWTISNGVCPSTSDSVRIEILDLLIPTGFSPNNDGRNDTWVVRGGQNYGTVRVQIFNRWGNLVFNSDNYQNDWNGLSNNGAELADDTYYYIVNLGDGQEFNGYVVIKR